MEDRLGNRRPLSLSTNAEINPQSVFSPRRGIRAEVGTLRALPEIKAEPEKAKSDDFDEDFDTSFDQEHTDAKDDFNTMEPLDDKLIDEISPVPIHTRSTFTSLSHKPFPTKRFSSEDEVHPPKSWRARVRSTTSPNASKSPTYSTAFDEKDIPANRSGLIFFGTMRLQFYTTHVDREECMYFLGKMLTVMGHEVVRKRGDFKLKFSKQIPNAHLMEATIDISEVDKNGKIHMALYRSKTDKHTSTEALKQLLADLADSFSRDDGKMKLFTS